MPYELKTIPWTAMTKHLPVKLQKEKHLKKPLYLEHALKELMK